MRPYILPLVVFFFGLGMASNLPGSGDHGDSIQHFLIAKNSWANPSLFFDHWGKPLFTLLASPFAQMGFITMKILNVVLFSGSLLMLHNIGKHLDINGTIAGLVLIACPMLPGHILSGLTEPMFAFFLLLAILLSFKKKWIWSAIILSFLPFIRSEGWIMIIAFAPFFIYNKQLKAIPFLILGTLIYSIAGYSTHQDLLWVFTKTPYINQGDNYGSGNYFHFANQLFYWTGFISIVLFGIGLLHLLSRWRSLNWKWALVFSLFACFFGAHSLFWGSGLFHSMGLPRVLICVLPLYALVVSQSFNFMKLIGPHKPMKKISKALLIVMLAFPFLSQKRMTKYVSSFHLHPSQLVINQAMEEIKKNKYRSFDNLHCTAPWAKYKWQETHHHSSTPLIQSALAKNGKFILWDGYFSELEEGINEQKLSEQGYVEAWRSDDLKNPRNTVSLWLLKEP